MMRLSETSPRVLHVTTTPMSLGWLLEPQLLAFQRAGFDVVTASAPGEISAGLQKSNIVHYGVPSFERSVNATADRRAMHELREVIRRVSPHILHTHNPKPGVLGRLLGRMERTPIVINTVHGLYAQPTDSLRRKLPVYTAERAAAAFSDAELVQSIEDIGTLRRLGVPSERLHYLGNGIDLDRFSQTDSVRSRARELRRKLGIEPTTPVVGIIGRLVWEKGYREFFEAIEVLRQGSDHVFEVVVVGPIEPGKRDAVSETDIEKMTAQGVHFLGARSDIEDLLEMFDIFVLPSRREGFPRAAMEASAMGVPVVATDIRGCREVVDDGRSGLLYPVGSVSRLAMAIESLLGDESRRVAFGRAGAARARANFDQRRIINKTLSVYRSLLRARGLGHLVPAVMTDRYHASIDLVDPLASKVAADSAAA